MIEPTIRNSLHDKRRTLNRIALNTQNIGIRQAHMHTQSSSLFDLREKHTTDLNWIICWNNFCESLSSANASCSFILPFSSRVCVCIVICVTFIGTRLSKTYTFYSGIFHFDRQHPKCTQIGYDLCRSSAQTSITKLIRHFVRALAP